MAQLRVLAAAAMAALAAAASLPPAALELRVNQMPYVVTDDLTPSFSWQVAHPDRGQRQTAYRVIVNDLTAGNKTVWDSGVVASNATARVKPPALDTDTMYQWQVTWWDANGAQAPWSSPAVFATGLGTSAAWDAAGSDWIGCPNAEDVITEGSGYNQLRYEFNLAVPAGATVTQARAYVSGLGWYHAFVNGVHLGRAVLEPAFTSARTRVYYASHDALPFLNTSAGATNVLTALIGHGWTSVSAPWAAAGPGPAPWNGTGKADTETLLLSAATAGDAHHPAARELASRGAAAAAESGVPFDVEAYLKGFAAAFERYGSVEMAHTVASADAGTPLKWEHNGYQRRFRALLLVHYSDGSSQSIVSTAATMGASTPAATAAGARLDWAATAAASGWMCGKGALLNDSLYDGCTYDATQETTGWQTAGYAYNSGSWTPAVRIAAPGGEMVPTDFPAVEVVAELAPRRMWESTPGAFVFDFGQNFAGHVRLVLPDPFPANTTLIIRHAESPLHPPYGPVNGSLYYGNLRSALATDVYTSRGTAGDGVPEVWEPLFTWHGFRYIELAGLPAGLVPTSDWVVGINARSAVATAGDVAFPQSADVMNQLQRAIAWGQASNLMGNPSDCPQRDERLGWTGDSALTNEESAWNYDVGAFYWHWARSLDDATANSIDPTYPGVNGALPAVVPDVTGGYGNDPSWQTVFPTTVHTVFKFTGDTALAERLWPDLLAFVNYTAGRVDAAGGIGKIFSTWGDWCPPPAVQGGGQGPKPSDAYVAGASFLEDLRHLTELATAMGDAGNASALSALHDRYIAQFNAAWFDNSTGVYGNQGAAGLQTAQSAAIGVGAVTPDALPAVVEALVGDITGAHAYHPSVGIIGTRFLYRALTAVGQGALAVNMTLQTDYPSYGYAFNHPLEPATTLWELWDGPAEGPGMNSRNHIMQGAIGAWLYTHVVGIDQALGTGGFSSPIIAPRVTDAPQLPYASGYHDSVRGRFAVAWANVTTQSGGASHGFNLQVTIPANVVATVRIPFPAGTPAASLAAAEGGAPFFSGGAFKPGAVAGITAAAVDAAGSWDMPPALVVTAGSGVYSFALTW